MRFRIYREIPTRSGVRLADVPLLGSDSLTMHAVSAEQALANAKRVVRDTRGLVAISEEN
jgi:hypothetical protein